MGKIFILFQVWPDAVDITYQRKTVRHYSKFDATMYLAALALGSGGITREVLSAIDSINRHSELPLGKKEYAKQAYKEMQKAGLGYMYEKIHAYYAEHICDKPTVVSMIGIDSISSVEVRLPSGRVIHGKNKFDIFRALEDTVTERLLRMDEKEKLREIIKDIPTIPDYSPQSN